MIYEKIRLDENDENVFLETYVPDDIYGRIKDSILVIPGGGYSEVCSDREGEPVALAFAAKGFNAFVLHYSVKEKAVFPKPLIEASKAMKYIKDNAERFYADAAFMRKPRYSLAYEGNLRGDRYALRL